MDKLDLGAIAVTSTFLAFGFAHVLKEVVLIFRTRKAPASDDELSSQENARNSLRARIFKLLMLHVGVNNAALLFLLILITGLIQGFGQNVPSTVSFVAGALVPLIGGLAAMLVCRVTSSKLVDFAQEGLRATYTRCLGTSSALVVLTLGLNVFALFALTVIYSVSGAAVTDPAELTKGLSFFAFGTLFVTLFSRLSGGNFTNSVDILLESNLGDHEHRELFLNMNNYLQNVYQVILEAMAMVSTLLCAYFIVIGKHTTQQKPIAATFAYLNLPMLHLAFSMFTLVVLIFVFGFLIKTTTMRRARASYAYVVGFFLVLTFCFLPLFDAFFLPPNIDGVKYSKVVNIALMGLGLLSGVLVCLANLYFASRKSPATRSVNLTAVSSLTGGIINALSQAKLFTFLPMGVFALNLLICLVTSKYFGLLFVAVGFMGSVPLVATGTTFYSLVYTASKLAEHSHALQEGFETLKALKDRWYALSMLTTPVMSSITVFVAVALVSHLAEKLDVKKYSYMNPFIMMALIIGCLLPLLESGIVLRISSGIANMRLKSTSAYETVKEMQLALDAADEEEDAEPDEEVHLLRRFLKLFKRKEKPEGEGEPEGAIDFAEYPSYHGSSFNLVYQNSAARPQHDNADLVNYESASGEAAGDAEEHKKFPGGFRAAVLREAGLEEESLLNAPVTCDSSRPTTPYSQRAESPAEAREASPPAEATPQAEPGEPDAELHAHASRDYKILKNADSHYQMFDPKYHGKHFTLKKKSTDASGSSEAMQTPEQPRRESEERGKKKHKKKGRKPDTLDNVVRRSQQIELETEAELRAERRASLEAAQPEAEAEPLDKPVEHEQSHSREPDFDAASPGSAAAAQAPSRADTPAPDPAEAAEERAFSPNSLSEARDLGLSIDVNQGLLPPDVDIPNRPRRPTPKMIRVPRLKDLELGSSAPETPRPHSQLTAARTGMYENTYFALVLSMIPLVLGLGLPFVIGVTFGTNAVFVVLLFSTLSSSVLVQVLNFVAISLDAAFQFLRDRKLHNSVRRDSAEADDSDREQSFQRIGKIIASTVAPVINTLMLAVPFICLYGVDLFAKVSDAEGFPSWVKRN